RPVVSTGPPAANGTIMVIGRVGHSSAAAIVLRHAAARSVAARTALRMAILRWLGRGGSTRPERALHQHVIEPPIELVADVLDRADHAKAERAVDFNGRGLGGI